ncbi:MAG: hypothetical protein CMO01_17035, partial [Thalassobius sp.]|nr:hypothetical protein [Thalassovita sp.]
IENENGVNPITPIDKSETNGLYLKGLAMYDIGDRIRYRFEIPEGGNYQLNVRLRSGDNNGATSYWPNGYQFQVNGSTETFEGDETTVEHFPTHWGNSWFGVMHSSAINLEEGINEIIIQANGAWTILDYLEVLPATSSLRKSATLSDEEKIILFPNPASAATEYFNIEAEKDIFRITVFKMNGEQSINNEVIIKNNSAKIKMPTAGYTMPKFKP